MAGRLIRWTGAVVLAAILGIGALATRAGEPTSGLAHGLLWRNSPLAAVFPLVVQTPEGRDFYLRVEDAETGEAVLAAGITGGQFFRVLVPNGRFVLDFTYGTDWRGEEEGFAPAPNTGALRIDSPLSFGVEGLARKAGHVVTLTEQEGAFTVAAKGQAICQRTRVIHVRPLRPLISPDGDAFYDPDPFSTDRRSLKSRPQPSDFYTTYEYDSWSYVCD